MTLPDLMWQPSSHRVFIGVDGCRGGWLIASVKDGSLDFTLARDLAVVFEDPRARMLIDMPIGLPSSQRRSCDSEARAILGHRRSTLFPVATRDALYAASYLESCETNARLQGCRISKQLWNIAPRIRELDLLIRAHDDVRDRIAEGHPELAFMTLSAEQQALSPKRTPQGIRERTSLVNQYISEDVTDIVLPFLKRHGRDANITDCLDAAVLALMLAKGGGGISFVGDGVRDAMGIPMRIAARSRKE